MRLNKSTSHAIRILVDCARANGELTKVADLASSLGITMQNVFKIVHILSRAELLTAVRGRNGGVRLTRGPDVIRIGDIVRAMETTELELESDTGRSDPAVSRGVNRVLDTARDAFIAILDQHFLGDLVAATTKPSVVRQARPARRAPRHTLDLSAPRPARQRLGKSAR